jgi:hypothetical protein
MFISAIFLPGRRLPAEKTPPSKAPLSRFRRTQSGRVAISEDKKGRGREPRSFFMGFITMPW